MQSLGYVPGESLIRYPRIIVSIFCFLDLSCCAEVELEDDKILGDSKFMSPVSGFQEPSFEFGSVSVVRSSRKRLEEDSLYPFPMVSCEFFMLILCLIH